jgi:hypothetical protein
MGIVPDFFLLARDVDTDLNDQAPGNMKLNFEGALRASEVDDQLASLTP